MKCKTSRITHVAFHPFDSKIWPVNRISYCVLYLLLYINMHGMLALFFTFQNYTIWCLHEGPNDGIHTTQ